MRRIINALPSKRSRKKSSERGDMGFMPQPTRLDGVKRPLSLTSRHIKRKSSK